MADKTGIQWTDATWNPIVGCSLVSPACTNCYAMAMAERLQKIDEARTDQHVATHYTATTRVVNGKPVWTGLVRRAPDEILTKPLRWKKPKRIFVNSMSDLFHESVPDEWIDRVFAVMALAPQHTFQVLTKRSARMRAYLSDPRTPRRIYEMACDLAVDLRLNVVLIAPGMDAEMAPPGPRVFLDAWPLPNVWLGVTAEDQTRADERIPDVLETPAAERFVSIEPMLGPIDLTNVQAPKLNEDDDAEGWKFSALHTGDYYTLWADDPLSDNLRCVDSGDGPYRDTKLDWVICGGESGPNARPMNPDWARSLRDQCAAAGVPFFFKQNGEWAPGEAFGLIKDGPVTDRRGNTKDWMQRYSVCEDRADRLIAHSFTDHATNLVYRVGKRRAGRLLDGREHAEFPEAAQ
jgi:protein gp37